MAHAQLVVAPSTAEQARAWDGDEGQYWADHADQFDAALRAYQPTFMAAAGLEESDDVLDIGCGTGECSIEAALQVRAGSVLGVDLSERMLDVGRRRAEAAGVGNVSFVQADAQVYQFEREHADVLIARTSAMFFGDQAAAFANLFAAIRPGGRLVLLVWQELASNEWVQCILGAMTAGRDLPAPPPGAPGPFSLSDPDRVRTLLTGAGFAAPEVRGLREPMFLGRSAQEATAFMHGLNAWMLEGIDADGRARAVEALAATMRDHETSAGVEFGSAMWLVTALRP